MNSTTIHLRIGDPAALVQAFVGKGIGFIKPVKQVNKAAQKSYIARRDRFRAQGLTSEGKPFKKRRPNDRLSVINRREYFRRWHRERNAANFKDFGAGI